MRVRKNSGKDSQRDFIGKENIKDEEFALPLTKTRRMLSIFGALPCTGKKPYWPSYDRREANVFYSVAFVTVMTGIVLYVAVEKKIQYDATDPSLTMRKTLIFLSATFLVLTPLVFLIWSDVSELVRFMKLLSALQTNYRQTTGKRLEYRKNTLETFICNVSVVFTVACYYFIDYFLFGLDLSPILCVATVYGHILGVLVVLHWNIAAMIIVDAHKDMESELKQSKELTANKVFEFRLLWLSLRALADCMSQWNSASVGYCLVLCMSLFTSYEAFDLISEGEIGGVVSSLIVAFIYSTCVFFSCYATHEVEEKILMLFLVEGARPAQTTFKETVTVNRNLFLTYFSTISTYIIVLVQLSKDPSTD